MSRNLAYRGLAAIRKNALNAVRSNYSFIGSRPTSISSAGPDIALNAPVITRAVLLYIFYKFVYRA
jgi:hypothetical protein